MALTVAEERGLIRAALQQERERVAPKLEAFRRQSRIKVCYGGRGAGAKSWSIASLLCQRAQREKIRVLCTREIQLSLEESVYRLVQQTVERLRYEGWTPTKEYIKSPRGSMFYFRGLKDMRASLAIKGLEDIDVCWVEEASAVSNDSLDMLFPTIRKAKSELWFSFNREEEADPVYERLVRHARDDSVVVWLDPGEKDNPWWTGELQKEMEEDYKRDPDQAEHIWGGQPRAQGQNAVMSRTSIRGAMDRDIEAEGAIEIGVDVARFGDDLTVMYKRHGLKTIDKREFSGQDTQQTAMEAWDLAGHDASVVVKVDDDGVGGGVTDRLRELGAQVLPINFGGASQDKDSYTSAGDEMWFTFPIDEADIPNDPILMQELAGRKYDYDVKGRRKIEPKKDFKKRIGRSPDRADALLLTYYNRHPITGLYDYLRQQNMLEPKKRETIYDRR
ncbi:MAG: PBSX family phage terminase large subunit [Candidatus Omnitrophica bacterium]|nr:PBSX family phage terminase large subunit [Candidatus Omnitrophota bacterium]